MYCARTADHQGQGGKVHTAYHHRGGKWTVTLNKFTRRQEGEHWGVQSLSMIVQSSIRNLQMVRGTRTGGECAWRNHLGGKRTGEEQLSGIKGGCFFSAVERREASKKNMSPASLKGGEEATKIMCDATTDQKFRLTALNPGKGGGMGGRH